MRIVLTLAALALPAVGGPAALHRAVPSQHVLVSAPISFAKNAACGYYCRPCGDDEHDIVTAVDTNAESSHLENCNKGACSSHVCSGPNLQRRVAALWRDLQGADGVAIASLLSANADFASYNSERGAVQMHCEAGALLASYPLDAEQIDALE